MLVEFSVENFLSYREKVTFSMLASNDETHEDTNIISMGENRYLKSAVIYGANASGKSNLLMAMNYMASLVCSSQKIRHDELINVIPFKLDTECLNKPSKFEIIFYCDNVKYAYGFSATKKAILTEYLYSSQNDEEYAIFTRNPNNQFDFSENDEKERGIFEFLLDFSTEKILFLSTAGSYKKLSNIIDWFHDLFEYTLRFSDSYILSNYIYPNSNDNNLKIIDQVIQWVKDIDVGISDMHLKTESYIPKDNNSYDEDKYASIRKRIYSTHDVLNKDGSITRVDFDFKYDESIGTQNFFYIAVVAAEKISRGSILIIDELDSLHTLLSKYFISLFHNIDTNPKHSQLIFTTHDTNLLDLSLFRRDQIWFTEKNPETGATDLFSLYEFGDRTDVNVEKGYLAGIYGAIPIIKGNKND